MLKHFLALAALAALTDTVLAKGPPIRVRDACARSSILDKKKGKEMGYRAQILQYIHVPKEVDNLHVGVVAHPYPKKKEAMIFIKRRPFHTLDFLSLMGQYPGFDPWGYPAVPGLEGMGEIVHLGLYTNETFPELEVGKRVIPLFMRHTNHGRRGSMQDYVCITGEDIILVPDDITDNQAALATFGPMTAVGILESLAIPQDEYLIQSSGGSLGRLIIKLAKHMGIKTITLVRRENQIEELKALGADHVVLSDLDQLPIMKSELVDQIRELTGGKGAYAAIDTVMGNRQGDILTKSLADKGKYIAVGFPHEHSHIKLDALDIIYRGIQVSGFYTKEWLLKKSHAELVQDYEKVFEYFRKNILEVKVGLEFPLKQLTKAAHVVTEPGLSSTEGKTMIVSGDECNYFEPSQRRLEADVHTRKADERKANLTAGLAITSIMEEMPHVDLDLAYANENLDTDPRIEGAKRMEEDKVKLKKILDEEKELRRKEQADIMEARRLRFLEFQEEQIEKELAQLEKDRQERERQEKALKETTEASTKAAEAIAKERAASGKEL